MYALDASGPPSSGSMRSSRPEPTSAPSTRPTRGRRSKKTELRRRPLSERSAARDRRLRDRVPLPTPPDTGPPEDGPSPFGYGNSGPITAHASFEITSRDTTPRLAEHTPTSL